MLDKYKGLDNSKWIEYLSTLDIYETLSPQIEDTYACHTHGAFINKCVLNHKLNYQKMLKNMYNGIMLSEQNWNQKQKDSSRMQILEHFFEKILSKKSD